MGVTKTLENILGTQSVPITIAAGVTTISTPGINMSTYVGVLVGAAVTFASAPDGNVVVEVQSSPDNVNWDTVAFVTFAIGYAILSTIQKSARIGAEAKYLRVKVTNQDSAANVDVWVFAVGTGV